MTDTRADAEKFRKPLVTEQEPVAEDIFGWVDLGPPAPRTPDASEQGGGPTEQPLAAPEFEPTLMIAPDMLARTLGVDLSEGPVPSMPGLTLATPPARAGLQTSGSGGAVYQVEAPAGQSGHSVTALPYPTGHAPAGHPGGQPAGHLSTATAPGVALAAMTAVGKEDHPLPLHITAQGPDVLTDQLVYHIAGLPAGAHLSAGHKEPNGTWTVTGPQALSQLSLIPGPNWSGGGQLQITATEPGHPDVKAVLPFSVLPTPDQGRIAGTDHGGVREDLSLTASGQLTVTDPDPGEAIFVAQTATHTTHGVFRMDTTGAWHFDLDNSNPAVQALRSGDTVVDQITVASKDGTQHQVEITIGGTADGARIGGTRQGAVTEDQVRVAQGQLTVSDPDTGEAGFVPQTGQTGGHGTFAVDASGAWTYTLDNTDPTVQALRSGDHLTDHLTVQTLDGSTAQIAVTINGTGDAARISGTSTGAVREDTLLNASGQLSVTDLDTGEAAFTLASRIVTSHGVLSMSAQGAWHYTLDNANPAVQALRPGDVLTDHATVTSVDGTQHQIAISIGGTQDQARIAGTSTGQVSEDRVGQAGGQLSITDPDRGEAAFVAVPGGAGSHGTFALTETGLWHYQLDNTDPAVQALRPGDTLVDRMTVSSVDGTTHDVVVTIAGTADSARIGGAHTGSVTEDTMPTTTGHLSIGTPDHGQAAFVATTGTATHGQFQIDATGAWQYVLDNTDPTVQALRTRDTVTDHFTVAAVDGTLQNIDVTIHGQPDGATIGGTSTGTVVEDTTLATSGHLTITDPDQGEAAFIPSRIDTPTGIFSLSQTGDWSFALKPGVAGVQALADGAHAAARFSVSSIDGTSHDVVIDIRGTNDGPVLRAAVGSAVEDGAAVRGHLVATDADLGDSLHFAAAGPLPAGLSLGPDGAWSFDPAQPAYQHLAAGEPQVLTVPVTVTDGQGGSARQDLVLTVTGTNDAPRVGGVVSLPGGPEDKPVTIRVSDLLSQATDTDATDQQSVAGLSVDHGTVTQGTGGLMTLVPELNYNGPVTLSYTVADGQGGQSPAQALLTIALGQDAAVIGGTDQATVTEDLGVQGGTLTAAGALTISDPDAGEARFAGATLHGAQGGTLQIATDGSWSYRIDNNLAAVQQLAQGDVLRESFTVHSVDGTAHVITAQVGGTNDRPVLAAASVQATEGGAPVSGQLIATDVDQHESLTFASAGVLPEGLSLGADGHWTFDPGHAAYNGLSAQAQQVLTVPVTVTDSQGATSTQALVLTVTGTNDGPVLRAAVGAAVEDGAAVRGHLVATDADLGDSLHFAAAGPLPAGLSLGPDGAWSFDPAQPAYQHLAAGEPQVLTVPVTVTDGQGGSARQDLVLTVTGTNDAPHLTLATATLTEDARQVSGQVTAVDTDQTDTLRFTADRTIAGLSMSDGGHWTYTPPPGLYDHLSAGATATLDVPITVRDGQGASDGGTLHLTITGTNDLPSISGDFVSAVKEDAQPLTSGKLDITDVDQGEAAFRPQTGVATTHGLFNLDADGTWHYRVDNANPAIQALVDGDRITDRITVTTVDGTTRQIEVTINGTDDGARIAGADTGAVTEDKALKTGGTLSIADPDAGQATFVPMTGAAGSHGTFTVEPAGAWTYAVDNTDRTVQALVSGAHIEDRITVSSADGTTHEIRVTINGTDDGAVIVGTTAGTVTEDQQAFAAGRLSVTDPDAGQAVFVAQSHVATPHGTFQIDAAGVWRFDLDNANPAVQALTHTDQITDKVVVTTADGTAQEIVVTINGTDDGAKIIGTGVGSVTEDQTLQASGQMSVIDPDQGQAAFRPISQQAASHGSFSIDAAGAWHYTLDNTDPAVQALTHTDHITDHIVVTTVDGTTKQVLVSITGTDDTARISGTAVGTVREDQIGTAAGKLTVTDPDAGQAVFVPVPSASGAHGTFAVNPDGAWSYTLDNTDPAVQALRPSDQITDTLTVSTADGTTQQLQITINGTQDRAQIGGVATGVVTEDVAVDAAGHLSTSGQLTIQDADTGEAQFLTPPQTGSHGGTLSIDAAGHWTYEIDTANPAVQALGQAERLNETFTVTSMDGTPHQIAVAIVGTNDTPTLSGVTRSATEGGAAVTGQVTGADTDATAKLSYSLAAPVAGLTMDADGHYTFDPTDPAYDSLKAGQPQDVIATVAVQDDHGATTTAQLTVHMTGTNDVPIIGGLDHAIGSVSAASGGVISVAGQLVVLDIDQGESTFAPQILNGSYGTLGIDEQGHWSYSANAAQSALLQLSGSQSVTDTFTVHSADGTTHDIDLTIMGTNTPAIIGGVVAGLVKEDVNTQTAGKLSIMDPNAGQSAFTPEDHATQFGHITLDAQGQWTYALDNANQLVQALGANEHLTDRVVVGSVDGTPQILTINIVGTNDAPHIAGTTSGGVTEDGPHKTLSGQPTVTDVDVSDAHGWSVSGGAQGSYGSLSIDPATGEWTYHLDNSLTATQGLKEGEVQTEAFTLTVRDPHGGTDSHQVSVVVTGTNDQPVIDAQATHAAGTVTEDASVHTATGQVIATDADIGDTATWTIDGNAQGTYGSLALDPATGAWVYTLDSSRPATDALGAQDSRTEQFIVSVTDAEGAKASQTITVSVQGSNDGAVIAGDVQSAVKEDDLLSGTDLHAAGTLTIIDADQGEAAFRPVTGAPGAGGYGTFAVDAQGHWTYTADNSQPAVQRLGLNASVTDSFEVTSVDGTTHRVSVLITGTNDAPVLTAATASATEDGSVVSGQMQATDVDSGDTQSFSAGAVAGFSLGADGSWSFDPTGAAYQNIPDGQTRDVVIPVTVTDHSGATSTRDLTITVTGTNDAAVVTGDSLASVTEDRGATAAHLLTDTGTLSVTDVDTGEAIFVAETLTGSHGGSVVIDATGHWTYSIDTTAPTVQALTGPTDTLTERFTAHSADGTPHLITATIAGAPDGAQISGTHSGVVTEDGTLTVSDTLTVTDPDAGQAQFTAGTQNGAYGSLQIDAAGHWTYTLDNANAQVQALDTGDVARDQFTVTTADGTAQQIDVTIHGADDGVHIGGTTAGTVIEDSDPTFSGALSVTGGAQASDRHLGDHTLHGTYGTLDLRDDGRWFYTLDNQNPDVQGLAHGESKTDTITVTAPDGNTQDIAITIQGSHDLPVISAANAPAHVITTVTKDPALTAAMDLSHFSTEKTGVPVGTRLVALYAPGSDVDLLQSVATGSKPSVGHGYTVAGVSGYSHLDTHGWFGTNVAGASGLDTSPQPPSVRNAWDGGLAVFADGTVARIDKVCDGQNAEKDYIYFERYQGLHANSGVSEVSGTAAPGATVELFVGNHDYGTVTADANGAWSVGLAGLSDGDHTLHAVVNGTPSPPQVFHVAGATVTEQVLAVSAGQVAEGTATDTITGDLTATDIDVTDAPAFTPQSAVAGTYGTFSIDAQGHWSYTVDNTNPHVIALPPGQSATDTMTVEVTTQSGEHVTRDLAVTVTGTNEAPVLHPATLGNTDEDTAKTFSNADLLHALGATDPDGQSLTVSGISVDPAYGHFTHLPNGVWQFTPTADVSGTDIPMQVTVTDGSTPVTGSATLTINPVADIPVSFMAESVFTDFATPVVTGHGGAWQFTNPAAWGWETDSVSGIEHGKGSTYGDTSGGNIGIIELEGKAGEASNLYRDIATQPGAAYTLGFDLSGRSGISSASAAVEVWWEGKKIDTLLPAANTFGFVHHEYSLVATQDNSRIELRAATQDGGGPVVDNLGMHFDGLTGTEDTDVPMKLNMHLKDTDGSEVMGVSIKDLPVGFSLTDGTHTASVAQAGDVLSVQGWDMDKLAVRPPANFNGKVDVVVSAEAVEQANHDSAVVDYPIKLTFVNANDAPTISGQATPGSVTEDGTATDTGQLHAADIDPGDTLTWSVDGGGAGTYGTLAIDPATGQWTYTLDNTRPATNALKAHDQVTDVLTVAATDSGGAKVTTQVRVIVNGADDAAHISGAATGTVTEDQSVSGAGHLVTTGKLDVTDPDAGQSTFLTPPQTGAHGGTLSIDAQGNWHYEIDNARPEIQQLGDQQSLTETFTVQSVDGTSHQVVVTVQGTNDAPLVTATTAAPSDLGGTDEDTARTFTTAELLQATGATDIEGDTLSIGSVGVDRAYGSVTDNHDGTFTFRPASNVHHDDVPLTVSVTDGTDTTVAQAVMDIRSVTDQATPTLSIKAEQQVIGFDRHSASAIILDQDLPAQSMSGFAIEMTVIGGQQVAPSGIHGATLMSYQIPPHNDEVYIYKPSDLTIRVGGSDHATGIAMPSDGQDHRLSVVWSSQHGTLDLLIDGQVARHMTGIAQGYHVPGGGALAFGGDQDSLRGGFSTADAFEGQIFGASMAGREVDPAVLSQRQLAQVLAGDQHLLTNVQMDKGHLHDFVGHNTYSTHGSVTHPTVQVDTALASPNPGATLHLDIDPGVPADRSDHVAGLSLGGLPDGTVVRDAQGRTSTVSGGARVDITGWDYASVSATPPPSARHNFQLTVGVVTEGPDGAQQVSQTAQPILFDPSQPVPDATIAGDLSASTDEDTAVSGILTVSDPTAADAHFAFHLFDGQYGQLVVQTDGHWTYTPDGRADAMSAGDHHAEQFTITSADGTTHQLVVNVAGTDDGPVVAPAPTPAPSSDEPDMDAHPDDVAVHALQQPDPMHDYLSAVGAGHGAEIMPPAQDDNPYLAAVGAQHMDHAPNAMADVDPAVIENGEADHLAHLVDDHSASVIPNADDVRQLIPDHPLDDDEHHPPADPDVPIDENG